MEASIVFVLVFARISAAVFTAPVLGNRAVPFKFRLVIAGVLALTAMPLVEGSTTNPVGLDHLASALFSEIIIGSLLGLGVMIIFSAAQMAGTVIGQMAGIQISDSLDPQTGQPASSISQMFGILSLAAFALMGGPELVVSATLDTFAQLPLGSSFESSDALGLITRLLQQSLILTLRGVAPAVGALMISTIVTGLISRTYPQMNLLSLGLNSNLMVMLLAVFFTLGGCVWLFADNLTLVVDTIVDSLNDFHSNAEVVHRP